MNFYYDVLLNLKEKNLDSFYEWEERDNLTHYKKIPLFRVDSKILFDFIDYHVDLSKSFLEEIYNRGIEYINDDLKLVPYIFIISDAKNCLACKYTENNKIIQRSNFLLNDDLNIIEIAYGLKITKIEYFKKNRYKNNNNILRQEEETKEALIKEINSFFKNKSINILKYLYYEVFNKNCNDLEKITKELINDIQNNFNIKYFELYNLIILFNKKNV